MFIDKDFEADFSKIASSRENIDKLACVIFSNSGKTAIIFIDIIKNGIKSIVKNFPKRFTDIKVKKVGVNEIKIYGMILGDPMLNDNIKPFAVITNNVIRQIKIVNGEKLLVKKTIMMKIGANISICFIFDNIAPFNAPKSVYVPYFSAIVLIAGLFMAPNKFTVAIKAI